MARRRLFILLPLLALFALVPGVTFAAGFFGPILPQSGSCHCDPLPLDWGCVLQVIQNLIQFAVSFGVILMVLWIAYAGFSLMVSGGSPEARSQGKTRIMNAIVGILVILSAWLIVDFVMKILYEPNAAFSGGVFGPWNSILEDKDGNYCIQEHTPTAISIGSVLSGITTAQPGTYTPGAGVGVAKGLCSSSNTSCSVNVLQQEGLTQAQAMAMSCIAVTESSGGANEGNSGTGAVGLFQITGTNWNNSAYHSGSCSSATSRLNDTCNRQAAVLMFKNVGYQPWTGRCNVQSGCGHVSYGQYWNPNAVACVNKYDPQL